MFETYLKILKRELRLYFRQSRDIANATLFFLLVAIIFPFGVGSDVEILREIGVGVIWVSAVFSSMFGINSIFQEDYDDGTLNQYLTLPFALEIITLAKITANWVAYSLPIVFLAPFIAMMFGIDFADGISISLSLLFATPIFVMIGAVAAAISLGAKKKRIMLSLLVMPLYVPVLIYGTASSQVYTDGAEMSGSLVVIIGLMLFLIPISSIAGSRAIR